MRFDPSGEAQLRKAKHVRRAALRAGGEESVLAEATSHFGMGPSALRYTEAAAPLFPPPRRAAVA